MIFRSLSNSLLPLLATLALATGCKDQITTPPVDTSSQYRGSLLFTKFDMANYNAPTSIIMLDSNGENPQSLGGGWFVGTGGGKLALALATDRQGARPVLTVRGLDGSNSHSFTIAFDTIAKYFAGLAFAPDGKHFAYALRDSGQDAPTHLYVCDADGSHAIKIANDLDHQTTFAFSNDGQFLAYYRKVDHNFVTSRYLMTASVDGLRKTSLTLITDAGVDGIATISWRADDQQLAFYDNDSVYVIGPFGQNRQLVGYGATPAWSPTGARLAFATRDADIVLTDDLGLTITNLTNTTTTGEIFPAWSPDGKHIAYESWSGDYDHSSTSISRIDVATKQVHTLYTPGVRPMYVK